MAEALAVWVSMTAVWVFVLAVFIPTFKPGMGKPSRAVQRGGDRRRDTMDRIAGIVVMALGRLTIAILHAFEYLGVDMSAFDEALSRLTAFTSAQASSLREANDSIAAQHAEIDRLVSEDATQDQIDIADAVKAALDEAAAKLNEVTNNLENPPPVDQPPVEQPPVEPPPVDQPPVEQPPVVTEPPPVETPPVAETPPAETPPVTEPPVTDPGLDPSLPVTPVDETGNPVVEGPPTGPPAETPPVVVDPVPVDPGTEPVPAGDLPTDTPVVEAPNGPVSEVPADAPVVPAGDLPAETPVVPVTENTGQ